MTWLKNCRLLHEFQFKAHLWVEFTKSYKTYYTDGYITKQTMPKSKGIHLIVLTLVWKKRKVLPDITEKDFKGLVALNRCFYKPSKVPLNYEYVCKNLNTSIRNMSNYECSTQGILWSRPRVLTLDKDANCAVITPTRYEMRGEEDKECLLYEGNTRIGTSTLYADEYYYILKAYEYLEGLATELEELLLKETSLTLAGETITNPLSIPLVIREGVYDYTMLGNKLYVTFITPDAGCLFIQYHILKRYLRETSNVTEAIHKKIEEWANPGLSQVAEFYTPLHITPIVPTKVSYIGGVLDIWILCRLNFNSDYYEDIELPIHLVPLTEGNPLTIGGRDVQVSLDFSICSIKLPNSLVARLSRSGKIEDYLSPTLLSYHKPFARLVIN